VVVTLLVGILPHELTQPQPIELSVWVTLPSLGLVTEQLERCHDYRPLLAFVEALPTQRYALLETLAEQLAAFCFDTWPTALGCKVSVAKLTLLQGAKVGIIREWRKA
jgi:dihydroneopterin aldolase